MGVMMLVEGCIASGCDDGVKGWGGQLKKGVG